MSNIINDLLKTQTFATLPPVTMKVLDMIKDEHNNLDIRVLSKVIETDAALTSQIIRVANSLLFATRGNTQSVSQAIVTLGLNRITRIVFGISVFSKGIISNNPKIEEILAKYRWHTSTTAAVSKSLAKRLNEKFKEYEFIGGLLHDLGKLAMIQYDYTMFEKVVALIENGMRDIDAEKEIFGVSHDEVGAGIAEKWNLPPELAVILQYHSDILQAPAAYQKVVAVISFASILCGMWGAGFYDELNVAIELEQTPEYKVLMAGKNPEEFDFEQITFDLEIDFRNSQEFLDIIFRYNN